MAELLLDHSVPPGLHLISAFLAMENSDTFISLARACGGGFVTERVQRFIWDNCISSAMGEGKEAYVKNIVKKLIFEVESSKGAVLDELYELYGHYMASLKDDISGKANVRVCKCISFLFPDGCSGIPSHPELRKLVVPLNSSLNMLEGDTGCSIWPSSLYLSEFILSFPGIFSNQSCFEVGSGVGLVGICLSHVKASEVVLSDGDLSTLANMKLNLDLNHVKADTSMPQRPMQDLDSVHCIHLPWESARKADLHELVPDIVLGADIIYDPSCIPYLVQILDILLNTNRVGAQVEGLDCDSSNAAEKKRPVAYIASVIRNIDTFNCFLQLAEQANLSITDITETQKPLDLLPYMQSYKRSTMGAKILTFQIVSLIYILPCIHGATIDFNYPAVFNFGDSNSDTGDLTAALGFLLDPPNGQNYFKTPTGRFCDGRLIVDFLMDAMDLPFLNPYLESLGLPNFRKGCNFAAAGSRILPATASSVSPFSIGVQVNQFFRFKARALELAAKGKKFDKYLPAEDFFGKGLYMFDIGQNDLAGAFYSQTFDQIVGSIPTILVEFENGIKRLYDQGARNFWIHNTGPLGCITQNVVKFGTDPSKLDELGCVSGHNQAAKLFNLQLHALCIKLQGQYADSNITYVDIYTIKSNLIANYSRYGFEQPIMACCGYGGPPFNYDTRIGCGQTKVLNGSTVTVKACNDSTEYVNWDGIHYTEAANQYISSQILTGKYSDPPFADKMPFLLNIKF
ncbi:GDSL-like Lipase/Acylhydrolase superfamily protein [Euphorbia peplus]|nr:GDSL-like Lipase/Acylhydrolase superfamily protein [Euphorbia peplus]